MSENQDKNDIPKPEPSTKCVCPLCKEEFRTEKSYFEHYLSTHYTTEEQKQLFGKYFVRKDDFTGEITSIVVPRYVQNEVMCCDIVYYNLSYSSNQMLWRYEEEITREEAKKIVDEWREMHYKSVEENYQEILQKMFNEREE
jgi:uncharacterized C2H2 Zn-finger protein